MKAKELQRMLARVDSEKEIVFAVLKDRELFCVVPQEYLELKQSVVIITDTYINNRKA